MSATPSTAVNCGRCARLWKRTRTGFGICGCAARREVTGEVNPEVDLSATCEFALLSAKLDPAFMTGIHAKRQEGVSNPTLLPVGKPLEDYDSPQRADEHGKTSLID